MTHLVVPLFFLAALATVGFAQTFQLIGSVDRDLYFPLPIATNRIKDEIVHINGNETYSVLNDNYYGNYSYNYNLGIDGNVVYIKYLSENEAGNWTIGVTLYPEHKKTAGDSSYSSTEKKNEKLIWIYFHFNVTVHKEIEELKTSPSSHFQVFPQKTVTVQFPEPVENISQCFLHDNQKQLINLNATELENIEPVGECGVKLHITKSSGGLWYLIAHKKDNKIKRAEFKINVLDPEKYTPEHGERRIKLGEKNYALRLKKNAYDVINCELEDPHGLKYGVQPKECEHVIRTVTHYHEGVWKATYAIKGLEHLIEDTIYVHVQDPHFVSENIFFSKNDSIHLLCTSHSWDYASCSFVRPDGLVININPGLGNDEYSYYWKKDPSHDCGITILNPKKYDFGPWRCHIRNDYGRDFGGILNVELDNNENVHINASAQDVVVKVEESYRMKCKADAKLTYCWLKSPNGTVYSVSTYENSGTTLKNIGLGLSLGECEVEIPKASVNESGTWSCHMGIEDYIETVAKFTVDVTEDRLMSHQSKIELDSMDQAVLRCSILLDREDNIEFCRWISPHGVGINVEHEGKYLTSMNPTECNLTIYGLIEEDFGVWKCFARLSDIEEEQTSSIALTKSDTLATGSYIAIALTVGVLAVVAISIAMCIIYRRKKKASDKQTLIKNICQGEFINEKPKFSA